MQTGCEASTKGKAGLASRVSRFQEGFRWQGVPVVEYKAPADRWCGITRMVLAGEQGEHFGFHLHYFEIAPGGHSTRESHAHEHAVLVLRGRGQVELDGQVHPLAFGDFVYVAPHDVHEFRNPHEEPFGFLCIVEAPRAVPAPVAT